MRWMGLWLRIKVRLIGPGEELGREEEVGDTGGRHGWDADGGEEGEVIGE